jgi:serine phosphatase RsbU (regulator of sigma subunit)
MDHTKLTPQQLNHLLTVHSLLAQDHPTTLDPVLTGLYDLLSRHTAFSLITYQSGDVIFQEGDDGSTMFLIQSGRVAIVKGSLHDPMVLGYRSAGEIIGEMAVLEYRPRSASVVALEMVEALLVDRVALGQVLSQHPELAMSLMSTLSARLRLSDTNLDVVARVEEQLNEELEIAAQIQARLLPRTAPTIPGWDIAARLIPARKTSGDFYDFFPISPDRVGFLVADVVDKGAGAALYMAVSRTLFRTFALQHPTAPEETLRATNERIQADVGSDQFVTVFYGLLDSKTKTLCYANAGHNPAFVLNSQREVRELGKTGIPIGVFEGITWKQVSVQFQPGDVLIVYTDGVSEARNGTGEEFGAARLLQVAHTQPCCAAQPMLDALIGAIHAFIGSAPQFDDITLLVAVCQSDSG